MSHDSQLTPSELHDARRLYNQDQTILVMPLASGRVALFSRRFDFLSVLDWFPEKSNLDEALQIKARNEKQPKSQPIFRPSLSTPLLDIEITL